MSRNRDISKLLSTSNGKIAGANLDVSFENITDTGTEGTRVASGTTGQRGSTAGQIRFNTTTNLAEYYTGTEFKAIDSPPVITGVSSSVLNAVDISGGTTLTISGSSFNNATVKIIDQSATETSCTINSQTSSQIVIAVPTTLTYAQEPFDIKVENNSGLSATLENAFTVNEAPVITTSAGSLGSITIGDTHTSLTTSTIAATDDEGNTITFAIASGALPGGFSFNTSTGAITGTSNTAGTFNFTITATDGTNTSAGTAFSIVVTQPQFLQASGGNSTSTVGDYKYHIFTANGTFTVNLVGSDSTYGNKIDYLIVAGGGGGGEHIGGAGGAGGMRSTSNQSTTVTAQGYSIVVGGGGAGDTNGGGTGSAGGTSSAFSISNTGGGGGGSDYSNGASGGSGGGGGHGPGSSSGGSGTSGQGNSGGGGSQAGGHGAGGGGGKGGSGGNGGNGFSGNGGTGSQWSGGGLDSNYYAGGGGGGGYTGAGGNGATGGGGGGGSQHSGQGSGGGSARNSGGNGFSSGAGNAGAETGGGGGGGAHGGANGGNGGSGIVIVKYKFQ